MNVASYLESLVAEATRRRATVEAAVRHTSTWEALTWSGRRLREGSLQDWVVTLRLREGEHEGFVTCTPAVPPERVVALAREVAGRMPVRAPLPDAVATDAWSEAESAAVSGAGRGGLGEVLADHGRRSRDRGFTTELRLYQTHTNVWMRHAGGLRVSYPDVTAALELRISYEGEQSACLLRGYFARTAAELLADLDPVVFEAERDVHGMAHAVLPTKRYTDIALHGLVAARILSMTVPAMQRDSVLEGWSHYRDRMGSLVAPRGLSFIEDTQRKGAPCHLPYDDEGTPTRQVPLILDGRLEGFLADRRTAAATATASTGSGWGGVLGAMPSVRGACTVLSADPSFPRVAPDEAGLLWVVQTQGMHLANEITGDFSFGASGLVDTGDGRRGVRNLTVAGNAFALLENIRAVGEDLYYGPGMGGGFVASPHLKVGGLSVGH